ncbi:methyltransferase [Phyllobacterium phragmitis]|uniref:Methyltransferase n=2 Tax=Phyllobacterium phragmitis TaxID=2670329 RepID=A0A2S9IWS8_9HYPH|nr:methyltransferase [Phyllobacterium phragmitis]
MGYTYSAALRVAALLGVADHLADGPKTVEELARATDTNALKLYRVLRLLATRGVFQENEDGRIALTTAAEHLRSDAPLSLRRAVMMLTHETLWRPAGSIVESLRGNPPFKHIFGMPFFDYWAQDDAPAEDFHVGMSSMSEAENLFLARSYDFPDGATVVDIAGGFGGLLLRVLRQNPTLHGILFDQEHVLAANRLGELGADDRWELASGDFFSACPTADIYMLKYIVHDWPDEKAVQILRNCRNAMAPGGRVLVMDAVMPTGNEPHGGKLMDIVVMSAYEGGRERTEKEFRQLLNEAGLKLNRIIDTGCYVSIVEAVAAD